MRRVTLITAFALLALLFCFWQFQLRAPSTLAQSQGYTEVDLAGTWVVQWTGNIVYPKGYPGEILNGPWTQMEKAVFDDAGNGVANAIACFNGQIVRTTYYGSCKVNRDGTIKLAVTGDAPWGKVALEAEGVICNNGNEIRCILAKNLAPGLPANFTGIVATGVYRRQK